MHQWRACGNRADDARSVTNSAGFAGLEQETVECPQRHLVECSEGASPNTVQLGGFRSVKQPLSSRFLTITGRLTALTEPYWC
jgi:hypothetical protein